MRNRVELILKLICALIGAALLFHIFLTAIHSNPLAKVTIPPVPTLAANTNTPAGTKATNVLSAAASITQPTNEANTNLAKATSTNAMPKEVKATPAVALMKAEKQGTNSNAVPDERATTNVEPAVVMAKAETNSPAKPAEVSDGTNITTIAEASVSKTNTNSTTRVHREKNGTNAVAGVEPGTPGSNSVARASSRKSNASPRPDMAMMGMPGMSGGGKPLPELPPEIKARIDRIYESELLGMVMRPQPAALMGIAGNMAFLRSSNGQTGLVKEGDSLGDMKLVKIGINRVLVEEGGQKKELMIFNGYGGDSLLSKKETPDETTPK